MTSPVASLRFVKKRFRPSEKGFGQQAVKKEQLTEAADYLATAADLPAAQGTAQAGKHLRLSRYFFKYGISAVMSLPITDEVSAHVGPDVRGILLALVEIYQRQKKWNDALDCLNQLRRLEPDDVGVKLTLPELLLNAHPGNKYVCQKVVRLVGGIANETPIHAALML